MPITDRVVEGSKRRNTSPTTSTLNMLVEDQDCSGCTQPPEDGEFVICENGSVSNVIGALTLTGATTTALDMKGALIRMVWGSARRSDRQALGEQTVPVIMHGGGRFKTKYFCSSTDTAPSADGYVPGAPLCVGGAVTAEHRSLASRLVLMPAASATAAAVWIVGHVVRVTNDSAVSGTAEIEFMLYDSPRPALNPEAND